MGKARVWEEETLINELNLGRELAKQLKIHLHPSASRESRDLLIQKILSSYEKALSLLHFGDLVQELNQGNNAILDTSQSLAAGSFLVTDDYKDQCHKHVNKKRKTTAGVTQQVRVGSELGPAPLDDGYSWRKYGQKDILGANFPRAYYRCRHRHAQGCLATKLVQRSDNDHTLFEITYRGSHTCVPTPSLALKGSSQNYDHHPHRLEVKTEECGVIEGNPLPSFHFPSATSERESEMNITFPEFTKENNFSGCDNLSDLLLDFPYQTDDVGGFIQNLGNSESDLGEIFSAPTSVSNSPIGHFGFSFDQVDSDPDFEFDTSEFFS